MSNTTMKHILHISLVALLVGAFTSPAFAQQDDDERARLHFQSGRSYFDEGRYEQALQEFTRAYELSQREQLQYNLYMCNERLGNFDRAIHHLERFLATNPDNAQTLRARLEALRAREAQRAAEADAAARAREEAERRAAEAEAARQRAEAEAEAARQRSIADGTAETAEDGGGGGVPVPALIGYGVGGAGLAMFAVAGGMVLANDGDFSDGCLGAGTCSASDLDRQDRRALIADIGLGIGIAGAVTGLVLHLTMRGGSDDEDEATEEPAVEADVTPIITRGGGGIGVVGTF